MEFKNIIGNTEVKDYLIKSVKQKNILHSYLFLGTSGIGKLLVAKEFAKKILCLQEAKEECSCKSCTCFNSFNHPDFYLINEDGGVIKVEEIRNIMFRPELYWRFSIRKLMVSPPERVDINDSMEVVMNKFERSNAWNLPVVDGTKYVGYVSKSKIFSAYRSVLVEFSDD